MTDRERRPSGRHPCLSNRDHTGLSRIAGRVDRPRADSFAARGTPRQGRSTASCNVTGDLRAPLGGNNIVDVYPGKSESTGPGQDPFPYLGFEYGWETPPSGLNGGHC